MTEKQEKIKTLAEDYKMVLNEAKSMGCKNIKTLYNILLEDMELIVQSLEKQIPKQNDGWISIDERLPDTNDYILLSFSNFAIPVVGRYETEKDGSGAFYVGDELETCVSQMLFVNAWMELPKPYKEGEEE